MKLDWTAVSDYLELTKPRICVLALLMASLGFFWGNPERVSLSLFLFTMVGISLVGASAGVLNQYLERDLDAKMWRTLNRPLPSGRLAPSHALYFGVALGLVGEFILLTAVNPVTAVLGAATLYLYLAVYTPSKRVSPLSTLIGAVPGAIPPLLGWTASHGSLRVDGLLFFGILFLWQIPHFLAIAWMYKEDYARASIPVLPVVDVEGKRTSVQVLLYSSLLLPVTLLPTFRGMTGSLYLYGAIVLGLGFIGFGVLLAVYRTKLSARALFLASLGYLPALGFLMVWDRTF